VRFRDWVTGHEARRADGGPGRRAAKDPKGNVLTGPFRATDTFVSNALSDIPSPFVTNLLIVSRALSPGAPGACIAKRLRPPVLPPGPGAQIIVPSAFASAPGFTA